MPKKDTGALATLTEPAQQIWLAGLGAFAMAGAEGGRLFELLVKKGRAVEKANLARFDDMKGTVTEKVEDLRALPGTAVDRISHTVDTGMASVLHRLGVPTKKEIGTLTRRVEELARSLEHKPAARRPRKVARARRTTAKPVATA